MQSARFDGEGDEESAGSKEETLSAVGHWEETPNISGVRTKSVDNSKEFINNYLLKELSWFFFFFAVLNNRRTR